MSGNSKRARARQLREAAGNNDPAGIDAALDGLKDIDFERTLNSGDFVGTTALHWAARRGRLEGTRHLLKLGAKIKTADNFQTPLHMLAESGAEGAHVLVEELVNAAPKILKAKDNMQNTALDRAKYLKNTEMVNAILSLYSAEEREANEADMSTRKSRGYFTTLLFGKQREDEEDSSATFSLLKPRNEVRV